MDLDPNCPACAVIAAAGLVEQWNKNLVHDLWAYRVEPALMRRVARQARRLEVLDAPAAPAPVKG